ncbi:ATP-binding protein [Tolypothrix sp. FACHB-123]|uniref:ATP-binding protein n=1 Tax=Tolypothrix sp. FACHB-123 TaxID=2692868 RepID=UPI0016846927|nr:ATP-binding protein [Tolypothrix sp. FACHB-123]MBD2358794.1 ATP-binding protein [Tolypothrix sp. FACHB-123]
MSQNPFYVGGPVPPDYFFGRNSEVRTAFDQISRRAHLAIYGSPGMGKSSLLRYLASPVVWQARGRDATKAFIISINCTGISPFTPSGFWREILSLLQDEAEGDEALQTEIKQLLKEDKVEKGDLRRMLRKIGQREKFLLLLLDDYDAALHPNDQYTETQMLTFLSEFRDLAVHSNEGKYLSTIVTTFRRLNELGPTITPGGSPWYNHYLFRLLRPLPLNEVNARLNIPIPSNLRAGVLDIIDGHPALLQNAGYLLYDSIQAGQTPNLQTFTRDFESATEQYFRDTWRFSTEEEQILLMLIALVRLQGRLNRNTRYALGDIDLVFSQRSRELIDLEERGVILRTFEEGKSVYVFNSSMMEWWVIQEIYHTNEAQLEGREKVFLNLMSREQANTVKKAIAWVWQHQDIVQSLVWIVRKLGGDPT